MLNAVGVITLVLIYALLATPFWWYVFRLMRLYTFVLQHCSVQRGQHIMLDINGLYVERNFGHFVKKVVDQVGFRKYGGLMTIVCASSRRLRATELIIRNYSNILVTRFRQGYATDGESDDETYDQILLINSLPPAPQRIPSLAAIAQALHPGGCVSITESWWYGSHHTPENVRHVALAAGLVEQHADQRWHTFILQFEKPGPAEGAMER